MVPQGILFDLDETLTDRARSILQYAERFRAGFADYLPSTTARTIAEALQRADVRGYRPSEESWHDFSQRLHWRTVPHISSLRRHWETGFPQAIVAREGMAETLSVLHAQGIRLGIVTNGELQFQKPKITQLSIGRFLSTVVISEAVHVEKPDPRIFERALTDIGCRASETWFVGDDPVNDVLGATTAGLQAIWLAGVRPWPANHSVPHWQVAALDELIDLVRSRQKRAKHAWG